ncbi:hypothetical protein SeMB42_g04895 [Synchytrium endobioticum]|uniref:Uncharacterized protein n=1 Tax=Synchytrium endobioticum TaxID=286115 RepID=A0A507CUZ4_9FUNG|nr:hypothetical protein SeMB42_g04895 [Synchytrium endobioticum]TPX49696.1 hypothetical protein SeLEV6574_g01333 [Synchytrium endobioticum]
MAATLGSDESFLSSNSTPQAPNVAQTASNNSMMSQGLDLNQLRAGRIICVTHHLPYTSHLGPTSTSNRLNLNNSSTISNPTSQVASSQANSQVGQQPSVLNRTASSSSLHRMVPYATETLGNKLNSNRPYPLLTANGGNMPRSASASPSVSSPIIFKHGPFLSPSVGQPPIPRSFSGTALNSSNMQDGFDDVHDETVSDSDSDDGIAIRSTSAIVGAFKNTSLHFGHPSPNASPPSSPAVRHINQKTVSTKTTSSNMQESDTALPSSTPQSSQHGSLQWTLKSRRGHSALYSGIRSLTDRGDEVVHVGWVGVMTDEGGEELPLNKVSNEQQAQLSDLLWANKKCVPVFLNDRAATNHYEGYCKSDLWPLFHYILFDTVVHETKHWADYVTVNQKFADAVVAAYEPNDIIWVHDYHLLLVPSMIRKALPKATIGFFLHTPFPSSEIFRCLPRRREILQGVLGANLVGFQTYSYARHFISTCTRVLGLESSPKGVEYKGMLVTVATFPIGIDIRRLEARRKSARVQDKIASIREMYAGKKIIIGRDKLDHIKGIQHKLNAFERFLLTYPDFNGKVVLIQVTTPPQREQPKLEAKVSELVSRINGAFGSLEFTPVHHFHQHLEQDEYLALLSLADAALITSVRDGMNTTSHEFVACQQENLGPLILSEFTGTAGSLSAAMLVNPWDYVGVSTVIHEALTMSHEEKFNKHQQLYDHVLNHTALFWAASFVSQLREVTRIPMQSNPVPVLDEKKLLEKYEMAKKRLLMFDYDGTLTPIVKTPSAATPPPEMLASLKALTKDPKNIVYIISGRDQVFMDQWLGHVPGLGLSAEHGCFIKHPSMTSEPNQWINVADEIDLTWKNDVADIFEYYTERTPGSFVENKRAAITWHYRGADPDFGTFQCNECRNHLENAVLSKLPVEILVGKKNLEVRPISINKGEIVKRLVIANSSADFVMCVGDDKTDEDMFKALRRQNTGGTTSRKYSLADIPPLMTATSPTINSSVPTVSTSPLNTSPTPSAASATGPWNGAIAAHSTDGLFTITIGPASKYTAANSHLTAPEDVIKVLGHMADRSTATSATAANPLEDFVLSTGAST